MLNGIKVNIGQMVKFTMFSNWTFDQNNEYKIADVSDMDSDGWFEIRVEGVKDWHCCINFSLLD